MGYEFIGAGSSNLLCIDITMVAGVYKKFSRIQKCNNVTHKIFFIFEVKIQKNILLLIVMWKALDILKILWRREDVPTKLFVYTKTQNVLRIPSPQQTVSCYIKIK